MPETGFSRLLCSLSNSGKKATGYETVGFMACRLAQHAPQSGCHFPGQDMLHRQALSANSD
jgi:hypothetical protein